MAKKKKAAKPKNRPAKKKPLSNTKRGGKKRRSLKKKPAKKKASIPKAKGKRGKRYSTKRQSALLDKYHELRKGGLAADKAAKKVGVSYLTLLKWEKATGKRIKSKRGRPPGKKSALKKALKATKRGRPPKAKIEGLTLVTPTGFRIEGITTKELIKVLKNLK